MVPNEKKHSFVLRFLTQFPLMLDKGHCERNALRAVERLALQRYPAEPFYCCFGPVRNPLDDLHKVGILCDKYAVVYFSNSCNHWIGRLRWQDVREQNTGVPALSKYGSYGGRNIVIQQESHTPLRDFLCH